MSSSKGFVVKKKIRQSKLLCDHKFTRGEMAGKWCGEPNMMGFNKCKKHFKKPQYQTRLVAKLERVMGNLLVVDLTKNEFNEWEDPDTGFIFSHETQQVIGKRTDKREFTTLNKYDVHYALRRGWDMETPDE